MEHLSSTPVWEAADINNKYLTGLRRLLRSKHSSLFDFIFNDEKSYLTLAPAVNVSKLFFFVTRKRQNKLEYSSLAKPFAT